MYISSLITSSNFFLPATTLVASVFTLTVISIGRFVAIMFPLHARTSPDRPIRVIAAVWIASALISSPPLLYRGLNKTEVSLHYIPSLVSFFQTSLPSSLLNFPPSFPSFQWANFTTWNCDEFFPTEKKFVEGVGCVVTFDAQQLYYIILTITCYFLPVTIMIVNYR